jgi:uncharacterized integral membrane protein
MSRARLITISALILLAAFILFQNARPVPVRVLLWTLNISLLAWTAAALLTGMILGYLVTRTPRR